ncbi:MAG TPA: PIN domain-containing protein [Chthoniobacterales bacterium]|jgi:tRNA(fMet)-specific endonuclease VapC
MQYLLDTDTCIDVLRGVAIVIEKLQQLQPDECAISAITSFELFAGVAGARNPAKESAKVSKLLEVIEELPFEAEAARRAGALRAELDEAGTPIGPYDLLIAAHALTIDVVLVTANRNEFDRIAGLAIESWR